MLYNISQKLLAKIFPNHCQKLPNLYLLQFPFPFPFFKFTLAFITIIKLLYRGKYTPHKSFYLMLRDLLIQLVMYLRI